MELVNINFEALTTIGAFIAYLIYHLKEAKDELRKSQVQRDKDNDESDAHIRDLNLSHRKTLESGMRTMSRFETVLWRVEKRLEDGS